MRTTPAFPPFRPRRRRRGVILLLVLWIVVVLSLITYSLLFQITTEAAITTTRKRSLQAEALARAGIAKAIVDLRNDMVFDHAQEGKIFDAEGDVWARPEEGRLEATLGRREDEGTFTTYVYDEEGLLNINQFIAPNMKLLETIITQIGYNEDDAKIVAAAIVDWRDGDFTPVLPDSPGPDEGTAYAVMKGEDEGGETDQDEVQPLVFRNENFLSVDELLEVYGVTPDLYFGPDTPEARHYNALLGTAAGERFKIEEKQDRPRGQRNLGLRDYFTVHGAGTLNINTAPEHVLRALAVAAGLDESLGETIVDSRRGGKEEDLDNDEAFEDMTEVQANADTAQLVAAASPLYPIGVTSSIFRIRSRGVVGNVTYRLEALAFRKMLLLTRDEAFEYSERAEERLERNAGRSQRREDKENEQQTRYPYVTILQMYKE